jgi:hypothetical protein
MMANPCPLELPQIKSVLESRLKTVFVDWLSKTEDPKQHLESASAVISVKIHESIVRECPSLSGYKLVVQTLAAEQVKTYLHEKSSTCHDNLLRPAYTKHSFLFI